MAGTANNEPNLLASESITDLEKLAEDIDAFKDERRTDVKRFYTDLHLLKRGVRHLTKNVILQNESVSVLELDQETAANLPALFNLTCNIVSHNRETNNEHKFERSQKHSLDEMITKKYKQIAATLIKCKKRRRCLLRNQFLLKLLSTPEDFESKEEGGIIDDTMTSFQRCSLNVLFDNILTSSPCKPNVSIAN